jgi:competence protein ComEC
MWSARGASVHSSLQGLTRGLALVVAAAAWLLGILLASWIHVTSIALLLGAASALVCAFAFWRSERGRLIALLVVVLLLGAWRYGTVSPIGDPSSINAYIGAGGRNLEITGSVADEPLLETHSTLLFVEAQQVSLDGGTTWRDTHGQVEAQLLGSLLDNPYGPHYGDTVELRGALQSPSAYSSPAVFASMAFPLVSVQQSGGNPLIGALYTLRVKFALIIEQSLPQPMAALLIALVLSLRTAALRPLIPTFNVTGTAHLVAPSGFKVTILAGLIAQAARRLTPGRKQPSRFLLPAEQRRRNRLDLLVSALVILSIAAYTFLSGGGPAAIRAGIMGIVLVIAPRAGRIYNVYTSLALSALLMSMVDPFVLWDAGFQLSFLGTLGIVQFTPFWSRFFRPVGRFWLTRHLAEIVAVTLAAETGTLPIFALTFQQVSWVAPLTNLLTVPLLAYLIVLGLFLCIGGLISSSISQAFGTLTYPLLWYVLAAVNWCSRLPGAYLLVDNLNVSIAWAYYSLLSLLSLAKRWFQAHQSKVSTNLLAPEAPTPRLSRRARRWIQVGAALALFLASGEAALAARTNPQLTITFLSVAPAGQPAQGEAILIRTADGKTALIDGGLDANALANELDSRLPYWQRSLDMVILTAPRQADMVGLEDVMTRYDVGEVIDAGMLHPTTGYALFRHTISQRNLPYAQLRQGATFTLGAQVAFQVFWPISPLHKGSLENEDNGMAIRLIAPGLRLLLLGDTALSKYALQGLLSNIDPRYLASDAVQLDGDAGKAFPSALDTLLTIVHPSSVIISPAALTPKQRKAGTSSIVSGTDAQWLLQGPWQVFQTAQVGTLVLGSDGQAWSIQPEA